MSKVKYNKLPAAIPEMPWIVTIDRDHVKTMVDGEMETFSRSDHYGGHPMSGLASFGPVQGDHRMIAAIAEDIQTAFSLI
tara:strand:+ start:690 stop:929 length:240 start_codon:yes stop_codon:yes gene_type:complete